MKIIVSVFILLALILESCIEKRQNDLLTTKKLTGCWVGGLVQNGTMTTDIELRLLTLKPDSTLALTIVYELGPRSRVWEYNTEIIYNDKKLTWLAHRGYLSENGDTMYLDKSWKGEETKWMFYRDTSYNELINQLLSGKNSKYTYEIPEEELKGWICSDLSDVGIEKGKIVQLINNIKNGKHGDIHSILICRNGKLVLEEYFALNGKFSGSFVNDIYRNKIHQLSSVTKGVLSILCGIAIDQSKISSVDEPIYRFLPEYLNSFTEESKQIKIKDLLTMKAGWDWEQFKYQWDDPRNNAAEMYRCEDVLKYIVERPLAAEPGKTFTYSNGVATVLGAVLNHSTGMEVDDFSKEYLFHPLQIYDYLWTNYPGGTLDTDGGLALRARDMANIGQLILQNGQWEGQQIVSKAWITESTTTRTNLSMNRGYCYYWNEMQITDNGFNKNAIFVPGDGGQFMSIFPSLDLIVVFTGGDYHTDPTKKYWKIINDEIFPAIADQDLK